MEKEQQKDPRQGVLVMACLQPKVAQIATDAAKAEGMEVVILEDKVIDDYLERKSESADRESIGKFLEDTTNLLTAQRNLTKLYVILTGSTKVEDAGDKVFKRSEIVKRTNLTNRQAADVLMSLKIYGMIEFTRGDYEFRFVFTPDAQKAAVREDVRAVARILNGDLLRYRKTVERDENLTPEKKEEIIAELKKEIEAVLAF